MRVFIKKIKDKLYTFLVLKNSAIASEYQVYIMADLERHEKHKLRSWLHLINLNIKYRIFRSKSSLSNKTKKPYSEGSESSVSSRTIPIHFAMQLMKYDIISFDVFDTLILRSLSIPSEVFRLIAEEESLLNFQILRRRAEIRAREIFEEQSGTREINITHIYKELNKKVGIEIEKGINKEFKIEKKVCYANPYMLDVFRLLKENNKKIICTSDMYWPKEYLKQLLKSCGYDGFDDIFVSCDYLCYKGDGKLFEVVKNKYGKELSYIHIGDNYKADIIGAKIAEIASYYYKGVNAIGNEYRAPGISPLINSAYCGIVNSRLHCSEKIYTPQYEFGFIYGGLYILGFVSYINKFCRQENIDKILFIARDGDIYQKVYKLLDNTIDTKYLFWSRLCNLQYGIKYDRDFFLTRVCRSQAKLLRQLNDILDSFDLEVLKNKLPYKNLDLHSVIDIDNVEEFEEFLIDNIGQIEEQYGKSYTDMLNYLRYEIGESKRVLLVDIGWVGTAPTLLKKIIEKEFNNQVNIQIILAATHSYVTKGSASSMLNRYLFSEQEGSYNYRIHGSKHTAIFELFTQSCSPSFAGFSNKDNEYQLIFQQPDIENYKLTKDIQKGIIDFANDYIQKFSNFKYLLNISGQDAYIPFRFLMSNEQAILHMVGDAVQQVTLAGKGRHKGYEKIKNM